MGAPLLFIVCGPGQDLNGLLPVRGQGEAAGLPATLCTESTDSVSHERFQ